MVEPLLQVAGLSVTRGGRTVLADVEFAAEPGTITAIVGPNGAGKSTLVKAIAGLIPSVGTVTFAGVPSSHLSAAQRARQVAYVPQFSLLDASIAVRHVVAQGRYVYGRGLGHLRGDDLVAIDAAMAAADVEVLADRAFTQLSYGERRRVLIARALATHAPLVLLDEPTSALDIAHALTLLSLLRRLADVGRCVVTVMHDFDEMAPLADRVVVIANGRMALAGPTAEVMASPGLGTIFGVEFVAGGGLGYRLLHGVAP